MRSEIQIQLAGLLTLQTIDYDIIIYFHIDSKIATSCWPDKDKCREIGKVYQVWQGSTLTF